MSHVALTGVSKRYADGADLAVSGLTLDVAEGERFVIVGPSGSGKTTVLRMIAGLETPTSGEVRIGGVAMTGIPARRRGVAMVFQDQVLYPHLTVFENLAFGLRARRVPRSEIVERTTSVADWLGLTPYLGRSPKALSGGERQRVAIGRAVVTRPAVLLLDEPFAGLDTPLRSATRETLLDLHRRLGGTLILVTHDQTEALAIGDHVAVMRFGRLEQVGTPLDLYERPANRFVAAFLGEPTMAFLPVRQRDGVVEIESAEGASVPVPAVGSNPGGFEVAWLGIRPESITIGARSDRPDESRPAIVATLEKIERRGHEAIVQLCLGGYSIRSRTAPDFLGVVGDRFEVGLDLSKASWFSRSDDTRIR